MQRGVSGAPSAFESGWSNPATPRMVQEYMEVGMRKSIAVGAVFALGMGSSAMAAEGFSYTSIEGSFVRARLHYVDDSNSRNEHYDGNGRSIAGSVAFNESFFGFLSFTNVDFGSAHFSPINAGIGFRRALSPALDLVSGLSFEHPQIFVSGIQRPSGTGFDGVENGYGISAGLRGRAGERVELSGGLKYTDIDGYGTGFIFNLGGRYHFTKAFAAGVDFAKYHDMKANTWSLSLRYEFGR